MPFLRRPRPRKAPPREAPQRDKNPFHVSRPEWDSSGELPNLREKDTFAWPWGGTIEHTLNKAADPLDCEAWPNSPYCDIASTFDVGNVAGVGIDISANSCGVVVRATPTLFWLTMAPATVIYRRDTPECRPEVPTPAPPPEPFSFGFRPYKFGHWGCIYRIRVRTSITPQEGANWLTTVDDWNTDFFGPLEGFDTIYTKYTYDSGRVLYVGGFRVWAHGRAAFYPFGYGDAERPLNNPSWAPTNVWDRGVHSPLLEAQEIQFEVISLEEIHGGQMAWTPGRDPNLGAKVAFNQQNCRKWKQLPPPPLPYLEDPGMCNCKQMEQDLKQIKRLLGADKGGWKLPKSLSGRSTESVSHDNYADLMVWFAGQMSALLGDTEIVITQKDSSLLEEGNQERQLKFENLAEAMADALGLLLENQAKVDAIYRAAAQGLAQAGVAATSAAKGLEYLEDLVDFLDYETEEKSFDFPLFFTPDKDAPHEALKPSTAKLVYQSFTGKRSFNSFRFTMEQCAAIIRAVYWQRVDEDSMSRFKGSLDTLRQNANSENEGDLDTFLERIEQGFPEVPGNVDQSQPYGAPYSQRPKIRKLSQGGQPDGSNP